MKRWWTSSGKSEWILNDILLNSYENGKSKKDSKCWWRREITEPLIQDWLEL